MGNYFETTVIFAKLLRQIRIVWIVLLLVQSAMHNHIDDLTLLLFLQRQFEEFDESVRVVLLINEMNK